MVYKMYIQNVYSRDLSENEIIFTKISYKHEIHQAISKNKNMLIFCIKISYIIQKLYYKVHHMFI